MDGCFQVDKMQPSEYGNEGELIRKLRSMAIRTMFGLWQFFLDLLPRFLEIDAAIMVDLIVFFSLQVVRMAGY